MAGGIQVVRIATYKRLDERLIAHVKGVTRPPTARPVEPAILSVHPRVELGAIVELDGAGAAAGRETIERTRPTGRGRKPGEAIEILLAGPPAYGTPEQWTDARELEWARESIAWVRETIGPDSIIVTAALHRDETSPHVQAVIVPVHKGRLGWTGVRDAAAARAVEAGTANPERGRRSKYSALQDDYQARVGRRFGLSRGRVGSEAKHDAIDRAKAVEAREERARASAAALEAEAEKYRDETGAQSDRVVQLVERERQLRRKVRDLEVDRDELRVRRDEEARAVAIVVERREREEAIAGGLLTGRRSRKGRELVAQFEAQIEEAVRRERERAMERDEARTTARDAGALAMDATATARREREEREGVEKRLAASERALGVSREAVRSARTAGVVEGLRLAGRALGAVLDRLAAVSVERYPLLGQLLAACERGDAAGVELLARDDEAPVPGPRPWVRPGRER